MLYHIYRWIDVISHWLCNHLAEEGMCPLKTWKSHLSESKPLPLGVLDCGEGKRKKRREWKKGFLEGLGWYSSVVLNCKPSKGKGMAIEIKTYLFIPLLIFRVKTQMKMTSLPSVTNGPLSGAVAVGPGSKTLIACWGVWKTRIQGRTLPWGQQPAARVF